VAKPRLRPIRCSGCAYPARSLIGIKRGWVMVDEVMHYVCPACQGRIVILSSHGGGHEVRLEEPPFVKAGDVVFDQGSGERLTVERTLDG
jgi:hypothetical protein